MLTCIYVYTKIILILQFKLTHETNIIKLMTNVYSTKPLVNRNIQSHYF